ncbi:hypothetical protein IU405_05095 [Polaribacter sp. BAL334]|uniref:polysaccharide lyase family 8 super-sandwich domain-containing protein n=1 Tax=Polaribacter sp. BAL334 TaxID=1708178 RepID=UPI0018D24C39|nr:polysaccharide lyase family 8 super-sandwich domain-containing protein [Polaribacter sp. BAL334]MBG7611621.1 hypothetical protein [Polaribacter sp. BAL334]
MALNGNIPAKVTVKPDDVKADHYLSTLTKNGSWDDINYEIIGIPYPALKHVERFYQIAIAYQQNHSKFYHLKEVKNKLLLIANYFYDHYKPSSHWHTELVTVPSNWFPGLLLMKTDDEFGFSKSDLQKFSSLLSYCEREVNGVNIIYVNQPSLFKAAIEEDSAQMQKAFKAISGVIKVTSGKEEGLKVDYSWQQHRELIYFQGYGSKFVNMSVDYYALASGTAFEFDANATKILTDYLLKGQQWVIHYNAYDYGVSGRQLTQYPFDADGLLSPINKLIAADVEQKAELLTFKDHIKGNAFTLPGNQHFWKSDMMIQRGSDWYISIRNTSSRSVSTETINGENAKNAYMGLGNKCIMLDGNEYKGMPIVWDWSRLPGTTFESEKEFTIRKWIMYPPFDFAGGVSNGRYGLSVYKQLLNSENKLDIKPAKGSNGNPDFKPVSAYKLDLMTDEGVYSIGGGITGNADYPVLTNINQCNSSDVVTISTEKAEIKLKDPIFTAKDIQWVHHQGIGYFFPASQNVNVFNRIQTGSRSDVNLNSKDSTLVSRKVFSLFLDHGKQPIGDQYEYITLPSKTTKQLKNWKNTYTTLVNNDKVQAVTYQKKGVYGASFYVENESVQFNKNLTVSVNKPCLLLIETLTTGYSISVADPTAQLNGFIEVSISKTQKQSDKSTMENVNATLLFELPEGDFSGSSVTKEVLF